MMKNDFEKQKKDFSIDYKIPAEFINNVGSLTPLLKNFLSEERFQKMQRILKNKSRRVITVFENTHHAHNISAVIRNVDSFGFLDLFFVYSNRNMRFRVADNIDRGASQWLFPKRFEAIEDCAKLLKASGVKIALVSLPDFSRTSQHYMSQIPSFSSAQFFEKSFHDVVGEEKIAFVFGSELHGVHEDWNQFADMYVHVDMFGFTESLNVSVCAGILLHSIRQSFANRYNSLTLTECEENLILENWVAKDYLGARQFISNRHPDLLSWFDFVRSGKFFSVS